jgi:hypothetical protein
VIQPIPDKYSADFGVVEDRNYGTNGTVGEAFSKRAYLVGLRFDSGHSLVVRVTSEYAKSEGEAKVIALRRARRQAGGDSSILVGRLVSSRVLPDNPENMVLLGIDTRPYDRWWVQNRWYAEQV